MKRTVSLSLAGALLGLYGGATFGGFVFPVFPNGGSGVSVDVERVQPVQTSSRQAHAAKFVCGTLEPTPRNPQRSYPLAPGNYKTVVNIFNPSADAVAYRMRFAVLTSSLDGDHDPAAPVAAGEEIRNLRLEAYSGIALRCKDIRTNSDIGGEGGRRDRDSFIDGVALIEAAIGSPLQVSVVYSVKSVDDPLACTDDEDCPPGYDCYEGRCEPD